MALNWDEYWMLVSALINSHIRHSCAGRALLRWRKECGRLWVQLARAAQAPMHIVAYMYIDSYWFLPVTSSFIITCIYHFPQIIIIFNCCHNDIWLNSVLLAFELFKSQQYWVQPYVIIQVIRTWHQPSFNNFGRKIDREIISNLCVIRLLYPAYAHNLIIHFISFEV